MGKLGKSAYTAAFLPANTPKLPATTCCASPPDLKSELAAGTGPLAD